MTEVFAGIILLLHMLWWLLVIVTGLGFVLALIVLPLAWLYSLFAPPD